MRRDPDTGNTSYRPVLATTVAAAIDVTSSPATSGSTCRPDAVAETPLTYCRCVGRNVMAPSIANPTMNASTTQTEKTDERKSRSGRIGSTARDSKRTKSASATTDPANRPRMKADVHEYWVPAQ
jgi:hypothetical protein